MTPFPKTSKPAERALANAGLMYLENLTQLTESELAKLHGMGPKALGILKQSLAEKGLSFKAAKGKL